jgi:hypothetical protein
MKLTNRLYDILEKDMLYHGSTEEMKISRDQYDRLDQYKRLLSQEITSIAHNPGMSLLFSPPYQDYAS